MSSFAQLETLGLGQCNFLRSLSDLSSLTRLMILDLSGCESLQSISGLSRLKQLHTLKVPRCPMLRDIDALRHINLINLESDDPEEDIWILAQTRLRVSAEVFFSDWSEWCELAPWAKKPARLVEVEAAGLQKFDREDQPENALAKLEAAVRQTGSLDPLAWRALLGCYDLVDREYRNRIEQLVKEIPSERLLDEALGAALEVAGNAASAEKS